MMRYRYRWIGVLVLMLTFGGCDAFSSMDDSAGSAGSDQNRQQLRELSASEPIMVEGSKKFAFNLLQKLNEKEQRQSFFVSLLSISTAVGQPINGERVGTLGQRRESSGYTE